MLPPRMLQALGGMAIVAGVLAFVFAPARMAAGGLVVGVGIGLGILATTFVGGGPEPLPTSGFAFEDAMAVLRRASIGGVLLAGATVAVAAALWWMGLAAAIDVVQIFLLGLIVAYLSTLAGAGVVLVTSLHERDES